MQKNQKKIWLVQLLESAPLLQVKQKKYEVLEKKSNFNGVIKTVTNSLTKANNITYNQVSIKTNSK